jgi:hypothetical protein
MLVVVGNGFGTRLNVAVTDEFVLLIAKLHGLVALLHVVVPPPNELALQPANVEPALGVAVSVPAWLLSTDLVHVVVHAAAFGSGAKSVNETVPDPVPANVIVRFFAAEV